jgi:hypothetical protein
MTRTSSRGPQWPREQAGRGCQTSGGAVKDLVEPCKSISRSRSGKHLPKSHTGESHCLHLAPRNLPRHCRHGSGLSLPCLCMGKRWQRWPRLGIWFASSRCRGGRRGVRTRRAGRGHVAIRRDRVARAEGLNAKSRWERRSPEPEHLVGGELGDHGGGARPERSRRRWTRTRVEQDRQRVTRRDRWTVSAGATPIERLSSARRAASKGGEIGTN